METIWTSPYHAVQSLALAIALLTVSVALWGSIRSLWAEFREPARGVSAEKEKPTGAGEHTVGS